MSTGGGFADLNETMVMLNAPGMSQQTFSAIEEEVSQWWQSVLEEDLISAGTEEWELAIARGDYHQGIPAITVICDGGWSKRAHKHTYNAAGGVAVIIGACTKKLLHIGVRNKNCYICTRAETLNRPPLEHKCFRNWKESSQAMEADIIVEGFKKSEGMHGVRYMRVIADGDSSVYARIQEQVAGWGRDVKKLECSNHVCKCLRSSLENLVNEKPHYKGKNKLTQRTRVRLTSAVRCAIKMRSAEDIDRQSALKKLRHDIKNSVYHIYGDHRNCSDFCHARTDPAAAAREAGEAEKASTTEDDGIVPEVLGQQHDYWTQGSDDVALKESRLSGELKSDDLDPNLLRDISLLLERVVNKADRLLGNFTSNLAECWMSVRAKFDGGKVINRCNRGSWHARCFGSALQFNQGSMWSPQTWETVSGTPAGVHFTALFDNRQQQTAIRRRIQRQPRYKSLRWKRKIAAASKCRTKKARMEYGPQAVEVVSDCSPEELKEATDLFMTKHINLDEGKLQGITDCTKNQHLSGPWKEERRKRLTASNFKAVVDRNPALKVAPLVRQLVHGTFKGNASTRHGLDEEETTLKEYVIRKAESGVTVSVAKTGLVVCREYLFLAASPDGIVTDVTNGEQGLLEVKNLLKNKSYSLREAVKKEKSFCLQLTENVLSLKKSHAYYHQCQGQLNVVKLPWLDFIVRRVNPHELFIERLYRDEHMWKNVMVPKLSAFYHKALLPELSVPRYGSSPGIREPGVWVSLDVPCED